MIVRTRARCVVETALALLVSASVTWPAEAQSRRAMTVDDVLDLVQVSAPRISPDGRRVVYTLSELAKWKDNKRVTSIWIADAACSRRNRTARRWPSCGAPFICRRTRRRRTCSSAGFICVKDGRKKPWMR